jgi:hypothetical protein
MKHNSTRFTLSFGLLLSILVSSKVFSQNNKVLIGFWNVENLYDTINDPAIQDDEFTPKGTSAWGDVRYKTKLNHLSDAISQMGVEENKDGLAVLGLSEIENSSVLNDLVNSEKLKQRKYKVIHFDGPDARGIDVALLYNPKYFKLSKTKIYHVTLPTDTAHKTRDQLVVNGQIMGEEINFIVLHWPSRRGGESETKPNRIAAAMVTKHISDSLQKSNPNCKLIIMGDLNDDPSNESINVTLGAKENKNSLQGYELYNTMWDKHKTGTGTLAYKDSWNLFDQFIISKALVGPSPGKLTFVSSAIFNKPFLTEAEGKYKGQPFRTYAGPKYLGGYSDHLPVYMILGK